MNILTYNILDGGQPDRLHGIVEVVRAAAPDVLVLNECDHFDEDDQRALRELERALQMRGHLQVAPTGRHLALLTRAARVSSFEPLPGPFHHGAFRARLAYGDESLTVLGTHLSPFDPDERLGEARCLADAVEPSTILLGDLNALSPHDAAHHGFDALPARYRSRHARGDRIGEVDTRVMERLEAAGLEDLFLRAHPGDWRPTRPTDLLADRPRQRLDYALASADLAARLQACEPIDTPASRRASDHLPLLARLRP